MGPALPFPSHRSVDPCAVASEEVCSRHWVRHSFVGPLAIESFPVLHPRKFRVFCWGYVAHSITISWMYRIPGSFGVLWMLKVCSQRPEKSQRTNETEACQYPQNLGFMSSSKVEIPCESTVCRPIKNTLTHTYIHIHIHTHRFAFAYEEGDNPNTFILEKALTLTHTKALTHTHTHTLTHTGLPLPTKRVTIPIPSF